MLAENPDHAKVLQQLGWLYHQQNTSFCNQTLAIQYLTRSLKSDSNDAQSWYLLGRCYMAEQNYNKAYEAYQQAVYRDARNPTFWCSIGVLYYQINQYRDALDAYSRAIRLNPYISEVWYDLGTLYESCNNQVQDALDAYQRAAELDPSNPHIKQRLELLRKSQNVQSSQPGSAPIPQDVSNPSQYQSGHNGQPLSGASYSQSAPTGPPSSMSAYHTALGSGSNAPLRPNNNDERVPTPQLPVVNHNMSSHESTNGPVRDLPMPGPPPTGSGRRSPGPYGQYPPSSASHPSSSNQREDVRIPDIGGGRAPTPSDRSQMNPIIHDERQQHPHHPQQQQQQPLPPQQQQQHMPPQQQPPPQHMSPQQQHQAQQHSPQTNLPPMSMRQPYKEEIRSPNPAPMSSPHSRPSPRTSHPLAPPAQFDHRLSPRTGHSDRFYEQRSPAQRPMEVDSSNTSSPRTAPRSNEYHRMKHEEYNNSNRSAPQPMDYSTKEDVKKEEHHHLQQQQQLQQLQQQQQQQQQHQHQQHSKDHQKRPLLEPVHPERYPRPDLNQWQSYKPAVRPANASPIITSVVPTAPVPEQQITPQIPVKIEPITQSVIPPQQQQQPSWNSPSIPVPIISNAASAAVIAPSIPPSSLPDAVAYFVSNLPPAQTFNGPMIQSGELVDLLRSIIIPLPPQSGNVASQQPPPQQQQQQQSQRPNKPPMHQQQQNRDSGRGGNNYGNQRGGRGGYNKRGGGNMPMRGGGSGGKPNMKRRGRDDYDDDYQPHKGKKFIRCCIVCIVINGFVVGMGPNRPPDFDLFRQRQAKRHRDDPPY